MDFTWFYQTTAGTDWWALVICPALLIVAGLTLAIAHAKKAYPTLALALGGAQLFLLCNVSNVQPLYVCAWAGLYLVLCVLVRLLFFIPFRGKKRKNRAEEIYQKFHLALELPEETQNDAAEEARVGMAENVHLQHVLSLLEKLRACNLTPGDRLETDAIERTLEAFQGKDLTADDLVIVNDSLASVLKMTAKYKL